MVKIHIGEQQTRALCDSGAEITCINEHFSNSTQFDAIKVLNSESIVIIRIKGEHLLYSKISGEMIGYVWYGQNSHW
jgi:hypothetical protein